MRVSLWELWPYIEADFLREYGIDLLASDMSWRRFCALYAGLSPGSLTCLCYGRAAARGGAAEDDAWAALTGGRTGTR